MQTIAVYLFVGQSVLGLSIAPCQEVVEPSQTALLSSFDMDSEVRKTTFCALGPSRSTLRVQWAPSWRVERVESKNHSIILLPLSTTISTL